MLFTTACQVHDGDLVIPKEDNAQLKISKITSLNKEPQIQSILSKVDSKLSNQRVSGKSWSLSDVDTDYILKMLQYDSTFYAYTFNIPKAATSKSFSNLILRQVNGGYIGNIYVYEAEDKLYYSEKGVLDFKKFTGILKVYNLEGNLLKTNNWVNGNQEQQLIATESSTTYCVDYFEYNYECVGGSVNDTAEGGYGLNCDGVIYLDIYVKECDNASVEPGYTPSYGGGTYIPSDPYDGGGGGGAGGSTGGNEEPTPIKVGVVSPPLVVEPVYIVSIEGSDAMDFDEVYWSNPNLTFPAQNLPKYTNFNSVYPRSMSGLEVFKMIGGEVLDIAVREGKFNACAARVSFALNYSGVVIPHIEGQTFKGIDGKFYFIGAANMQEWMKKTFGDSDITVYAAQAGNTGEGFINAASGRKGIYFMKPEYPTVFNATGHADIFNGSTFDKEGYFGNGFYSGKLWVLQ